MTPSFRFVRIVGSWLLVAGALLLAWLVRDQPWQSTAAGGLFRVDALSAFFMVLTLAGMAILAAERERPVFVILPLFPFVAAYLTTSLPLIAAAYLLSSVFAITVAVSSRQVAFFVVEMVPPFLLAIGWTITIILSGIWRYDAAGAGDALQSWTFVFVLLASLLGSQPLVRAALPRWITEALAVLRRRSVADGSIVLSSPFSQAADVWALAWLYPLLRLYSLGPWNAGWSFGTLLVGCAVALWCASLAGRADTNVSRASAASGGLVGLALACAGLSSAAGVAACCLALLCALLLRTGLTDELPSRPIDRPSLWLLSGALPITLPFVAVWLGMGAADAGGVLLATGAFWLVGLGNALAVLRMLVHERANRPDDPPTPVTLRSLFGRRSLAAVASLVLGVVAPLVVQWPILPVARQLQGGLSPYGDLAVWPWVGLAAVDAGRQQVAALPSLAVAGLMLVLCALAWLLSRLFISNDQ